MIRLAPWRRQPGAKLSARLGIAAVAVALLAAGCGANGETRVSTAPNPSLIKPGTLTVCTASPYPPYEYQEEKGGPIVGYDIDLVKEVAKALGVKTAIENTNFGAISSGKVLNEGKCDVAVAALTITGPRARVLDFSSPYFNARQAVVVESGSGIKSMDDLRGDRIGVQAGSTSELFVTDNAPSGAEVVPYKKADEVIAALDNGDVDAAVFDSTVVDGVTEPYPDMEEAAKYDTGEQYGMAVKKNSDVDLLRVINRVLAQLQAGDGKAFKAISDKYFGPKANQ